MQTRLVDIFLENARRFPTKVAVICGGQALSYSQLAEMVREGAMQPSHSTDETPLLKSGLRIADAPSSCRIIPIPFRARPTAGFLAGYLSIHLCGNVAVPLDKDLPDTLFERVKGRLCCSCLPEGSADVLFTTGTTGTPKAVLISHDAILADAENLITAQGYTSDLTFVINGPLNHIGSLSKVYPVLYLGSTIHIVDGLRDMSAFFAALEEAPGPVATFLVPASIRLLLSFAKDRLASLDGKIAFIETGAAPMPRSDMQTLRALLPHARLYNTYASTETGIISTFGFSSTGSPTPDDSAPSATGSGETSCVGTPMRHSQVFITSEGLVACQGRTLMSGYLGDDEMTGKVLRDGILYTGDIGRLDEKGRLWLLGRSDDVINVGGFKVAPSEVEDVALSMPGIEDCICVPARHPLLGTVLKLIIVPSKLTGSSVTDAQDSPSSVSPDLTSGGGQGMSSLNEHVEVASAPSVLTPDGCLDKKSIAHYLQTRLEPHKIPFYYEMAGKVNRNSGGKLDRKSYTDSS